MCHAQLKHPADGEENQNGGGQLLLESKLTAQPHYREVCGEKDHGCLDSSGELWNRVGMNKGEERKSFLDGLDYLFNVASCGHDILPCRDSGCESYQEGADRGIYSVKAVNCFPYTFSISTHIVFKENLPNPTLPY